MNIQKVTSSRTLEYKKYTFNITKSYPVRTKHKNEKLGHSRWRFPKHSGFLMAFPQPVCETDIYNVVVFCSISIDDRIYIKSVTISHELN